MLSKSVKRILISTALVGVMTSSALAQVSFDIDIGRAPPPPRYEVVPVERPGYFWDAGHWEWVGDHHVWVAGEWIAERPGYRWEPAHWVHHEDRWGFVRGSWVVDEHWSRGPRDWHGLHR